jgi:hypothetical protein
VFVTQTGLTYILSYIGNSSCSIYSSTDFFNTNNTLINSAIYGYPIGISFSSNGNGAFSGNSFVMYYSATSNTWINGNVTYAIGSGISDNGNYIVGLNNDGYISFANLAPSNAINTTKFTTYSVGATNLALQVPIGNNGVSYFYKDYSLIYKLKNGTITNTGINFIPGSAGTAFNTSPSGNFVVGCTSTNNNLIILAP